MTHRQIKRFQVNVEFADDSDMIRKRAIDAGQMSEGEELEEDFDLSEILAELDAEDSVNEVKEDDEKIDEAKDEETEDEESEEEIETEDELWFVVNAWLKSYRTSEAVKRLGNQVDIVTI